MRGVRLLDQRQDVAHAEDARRHAIRVERLDAAQFLADTDKLDRLAGHVPHRERRAPAGISVELGEDHARQRQALVEGARHVDRILALHGVDHEQGLHRLHRSVQLGDLAHHGLVDRETAGGVDDEDVLVMRLRVLERAAHDVHRVLAGVGSDELRFSLGGDGLQLLDRRRPVYVCRNHRDLFLFRGEQPRELARRRGLARTLQARHQDDRRGLRGEVEPDIGLAHERGELAVHHADERLSGRQAAHHFCAERLGAHRIDEMLHHRQRDIRLQQRHAHFAQRVLDVGFREARFAADLLDDLGEPRGQGIEHGVINL
jgi:hypothetical protein